MKTFAEIFPRLLAGESLSAEAMRAAMDAIFAGEYDAAQAAAFLTAMRLKGETPAEVAAAAAAMRAHAVRVETAEDDSRPLLDIVGTGGDGAGSFNISTAAALVAAGAGARVAKHGNRAVSGKSGSADAFAALGADAFLGAAADDSLKNIDQPNFAARCLARAGVCFLFAPNHHPAMRHVAPVRRSLGARTLFNLLGPLTNPAFVPHLSVGVFSPDLLEGYAETLRLLGCRRAVVAHGEGMDEFTLTGETRGFFVDGDSAIKSFCIKPEDVGLSRAAPDKVRAASAEESKAAILSVLAGEKGARRDIAVLNAAAGLWAAGLCDDLQGGVRRAQESIDEGRAQAALDSLIACHQEEKEKARV